MEVSGDNRGKVLAVCVSELKHVKKEPRIVCRLIREHGLDGDSHAGPGHRQVSILARESVRKMESEDLKLEAGAFGENILTEGIDLSSLAVGQKIRVGKTALLQITQKGKDCLSPCSIFERVGFCVMPKEGVFARVLEEGELSAGDEIEVLE